ncbi:MAG: hypothetical protein ABIT71_01505 [Vicinamibacteraceae bacterium]
MREPACRWKLVGSFSLIQQIRLVHALAESGCDIAIPVDELDKFGILRDTFGLQLAVANASDRSLSPFVTIDHATPSTAVGEIVRPLIFPRAIAEHCRTLWPTTRAHRYSFAGLLTDSRRALLEAWLAGGAMAPSRLAAKSRLSDFIRRQVIRWRGADRQRRIGDVTVWSSERGRRFPTKAWDEDYFRMLADSASVLCPSGDYVWSYRFFEACLCGAMPIVEQASPLYDGFRYRLMTDARDGGPWSVADAEHNYRTCTDRIVVPAGQLDRELTRLAALPASVSAVPVRSALPPS